MSLDDLIWLPIIEQAINEVMERKAKQEQVRQSAQSNPPRHTAMRFLGVV